MKQTTLPKNYREILSDILAERCRLNPRYSLRAFSRDLRLAPSRLSQILNGKQGLSKMRALQIAETLGFSKQETRYFVALVESSDARAKSNRETALKSALGVESENLKLRGLDETAFSLISTWYGYAIRELTKLSNFKPHPAWIAKALSISKYEAENTLKKLEDLNLIKKNKDTYISTQETLTTTHGVPSQAIRNFNKSLIQKATEAIDLQSVSERNISTYTFAMDCDDYLEYVSMIDKFRRDLMRKANTVPDKKKNEVYSLAIQFFRLTAKGDES